MTFVAVVAGVGLAAGAVASGIAIDKANKAAKKMEEQANLVPQAKQTNYSGKMIESAQNELNAQNPFLAYQNRSIQATQANSQSMAVRASLDPSTLLSMTQKYNAMSQDANMKNMMANYGMRSQKLDNLNKAYGFGLQEDQMNYDNTMTAFNSKSNLTNAAGQTRVNAWQNAGSSLMSAGSSAASMYNSRNNLKAAKAAANIVKIN